MLDKNSGLGCLLRSIRHWVIYYIQRSKLYIKLFLFSAIPQRREKIGQYPLTIQLPITWKCNFDCVMCGMHHLVKNSDFSSDELERILSDQLFKEVVSVGVNGGEPFIKMDLVECVEVMLSKLPKLIEIDIISNGFFTDKIIDKMKKIKVLCAEKNVRVSLSFSVDGVAEIQDFMRGKKGAWQHVNETIYKIQESQAIYCDKLHIICTITKHNIANIEEVEVWAKKRGLTVAYNIATVNARIDNYDRVEDFTIFNNERARMLAQEFFYKKFLEEHSKRYYAIYRFIHDGKRIAPCGCQQNKWVTLTPDGQISYCATHSKTLGNALEESAYDIFNSNLNHLSDIVTNYCDTCSHYIYTLTKEGRKEYYRELLRVQKIVR